MIQLINMSLHLNEKMSQQKTAWYMTEHVQN